MYLNNAGGKLISYLAIEALVDKQSFILLLDILITLEYLWFPNKNDPDSIFISPNRSAALIVYFLDF
jgi:hypothetical protein